VNHFAQECQDTRLARLRHLAELALTEYRWRRARDLTNYSA
jgi:hypothetical protein